MATIETIYIDHEGDALEILEFTEAGGGDGEFNFRIREADTEAVLWADLNGLVMLRNALDDFLYEHL